MARALIAAMKGSALGDVELVSRLRIRDATGDRQTQDRIFEAAEHEIARLAAEKPPALWLTYHSYYKAPDLLGPRLSRAWGIPYAIVEGTRASSRLTGPYARFAKAAELACDSAALIFYLTEYDREALQRDRVDGQQIVLLRPFLAKERLAPVPSRDCLSEDTKLVACGMFRDGDKLASYKALALALGRVRSTTWSLTIIGDGPARVEVERLFSPFGNRIVFSGTLQQDAVASEFRRSDLLVWPGVGEAFGMVYLEAQAQGCPVLAEDRVGVRDVVRGGGVLTTAEDSARYADMIDMLISDPNLRRRLGQKGYAEMVEHHLLRSARATIESSLLPLIREPRR